MIGPTPKFPQPPWAISMIPKPSFAKKKQRTKVLREIRKDPTSNALEAAKRKLAEPERDEAVEFPPFDNTDDFWSKATVEPTPFPSDSPFWAPQFGNDNESVSTAFTVETVTTVKTVTQTADDLPILPPSTEPNFSLNAGAKDFSPQTNMPILPPTPQSDDVPKPTPVTDNPEPPQS